MFWSGLVSRDPKIACLWLRVTSKLVWLSRGLAQGEAITLGATKVKKSKTERHSIRFSFFSSYFVLSQVIDQARPKNAVSVWYNPGRTTPLCLGHDS